MYYKESKQILKEINKAKNILLMCHTSPDPDSIVSCLVMKRIIEKYGKNADIFSRDKIHSAYKVIDSKNEIQNINPKDIDFDRYDIFFTLDATDISRYGVDVKLPDSLKVINIDHHDSTLPADIQIKSIGKASTTEILYYLFLDFKVKIETEIVNLILLGIISDSDSFRYNANSKTFKTVSDLIDLGGDYEKSSILLWRNKTIDQLNFLSLMLSKIKIDKEYSFAYAAMSYEEFSKFNDLLIPNREFADSFIRAIDGTNFGISMLEGEKKHLKVSIRGRNESFSLLPILDELGGGGYVNGGGASIKGLPFSEAVQKVLEVARKYAHSRSISS
jgi:bifunctional oligoribonuclease and PAP phosphatase NrnA